ncbi:hypothetical protein [Pseudoalteromonas luteoviolacea]|uniref:hypothetical protein n=1 Tax=Pseudoalteromonas luteoviolacea TaxID=43657 RepID=UPI00114DC163|nr:hypothetical protein [Pseudoalteromonas luteoviolacea]TQF70723.1 hypothetical protein FLM44_06440 [Pseudoalteromonas luteoviolacea]
MNYQENHSSFLKGLKVLTLTVLFGCIFYGAFFFIISHEKYEELYSLEHQFQNVHIIFYLFHSLWLLGTTYVISVMVLVACRQLFASNDWVLKITENDFFHQAPHDDIGRTFCIPISEIKEFLKEEHEDTDGDKYYERYLITTQSEKINIHDNSPFDLEHVENILLASNRNIKLTEVSIK